MRNPCYEDFDVPVILSVAFGFEAPSMNLCYEISLLSLPVSRREHCQKFEHKLFFLIKFVLVNIKLMFANIFKFSIFGPTLSWNIFFKSSMLVFIFRRTSFIYATLKTYSIVKTISVFLILGLKHFKMTLWDVVIIFFLHLRFIVFSIYAKLTCVNYYFVFLAFI